MTRELSEEAKAVLQRALAEERPLVPGAARRAQLKRSLLQGAALGTAVPAAAAPLASALGPGTAAAPSALASASLLPLAKSVGVGLLLSGALLGTAQVFTGAPSPVVPPAPSGVVGPSPSAPNVHSGPAPLAPSALPSASPSGGESHPGVVAPVARSSSNDAAPSAEGPGLAAELQLMTAVQAALRDGQGSRALELLASYDRSFSQGQLLGERLAAEVFAACQVGERARATRAAERFLQRDASSALAGRVQRSCAFAPGGKKP